MSRFETGFHSPHFLNDGSDGREAFCRGLSLAKIRSGLKQDLR
jgi:hypothetical protein